MRYLLKYWDNLKKDFFGKYIILFLDYDGTLTPIVETPEKAVLTKEAKRLLKRLLNSPKCKIAIISGRSLKDIKAKVGLDNVIYVGNHGLELEGPKIKFKALILARYKAILGQIKNDLDKKLSSIKGAFIEDKGFSLSLHYRLVNKEHIPLVKGIFHKTISPYLARNKIKIRPGKMVLEVRPPLEWDKGKVVLWLLAKFKNYFPIYIGDDKTDEDAFKVVKNKGLALFVGRPKKSFARYYLRNSYEVEEFLEQILDIVRT